MKAQNKEEIKKEIAAHKRDRKKAERKEFGGTVRVSLITKAA